MKKFIAFLSLVILCSCKSKALIAEAKASEGISVEKIIQSHYANKDDFTTLYIKASTHYESKDEALNVNAEIKIQKDEKILVSIRFLGITMAKALITPTEVKYYEKSGDKYFEGDYATLSKWLGTELDFQKVQNMLVGRALDDLQQGKYKATIDGKFFKVENMANNDIEKTFYFEAANFLIKKQEIKQPSKSRMLQVSYPNFKAYDQMNLPTELLINAFDNQKKTSINIEYNTVTFNETFSFPYSVPEGYERILID